MFSTALIVLITRLILGLIPTQVPTQQALDHSNIYPVTELREDSAKYAPNLEFMWSEELIPRLPAEDRTALSSVALETPLFGRHDHPFDFYATSQRVTMPIISARFMDDLAIASVWLEEHGCTNVPLADYIGILTYRGTQAFDGSKDPLSVLGIDREVALADSLVNDTALKWLLTAVYFVMAHEAAHASFRNRRLYLDSPPEEQETAADYFALDFLQSLDYIPAGASIWFAHVIRFAPGRSMTHPLTSARLEAISEYLRIHASDFPTAFRNPADSRTEVLRIADVIEELSTLAEDPQIQAQNELRSRQLDPSSLAGRCR